MVSVQGPRLRSVPGHRALYQPWLKAGSHESNSIIQSVGVAN